MACITVETTISHDHQADFYGLYLEAFGPLRERAAARHVLTAKEFFGEMSDPRILKYVAWDGDGRPEALSTLTRDLSTVPWISPEYFAARYPEHTARRAVYYWGFVLARPNRRRPFLFRQILTAIIDKLATESGVCAYDICGFNNETMRFGDQIEAVAHRFADVTVEKLDTQTYYGARFP
ncbi:MAG: hypothetical protein H0T91_00265 [Propionibacteriaceae bacterium]|nr:hypothetical protein [Propionibacteriaceae bacterium]